MGREDANKWSGLILLSYGCYDTTKAWEAGGDGERQPKGSSFLHKINSSESLSVTHGAVGWVRTRVSVACKEGSLRWSYCIRMQLGFGHTCDNA